MDPKFIWPLVGVVLGWFLKEFSDAFRAREAEKREIGAVLADLYALHEELRRLKAHHEFFKDRLPSWEEYERYRARAANRYLGQYGNLRESIKSAKKAIAGRHPLDSIELESVNFLLTWYQKINLEHASKDHESYVKVLSTLEVGYDLAEELLRKTVLKLARLHGLLTWLKVRLSWRRREGSPAQKNKQFVEELLEDVYFPDNKKSHEDAAGL